MQRNVRSGDRDHRWRWVLWRRITASAVFLLGSGLSALAHAWPGPDPDLLQVAFGADALKGQWAARTSDGVCTLVQEINNYGEAHFIREGSAAPAFELHAFRPHFEGEDVEVISVAPSWHRAYPEERFIGRVAAPEDGGIRLDGPIVQQMLLQLREGRQLSFRQQRVITVATALSVAVSPLHFRSVYGALADCGVANGSLSGATRRDEPEQASSDPSELQVYFDIDSARLLPESLTRIEALAARVQDPSSWPGHESPRLHIEGHTDATGTDAHNEALARRRAQAVAAALIEAGVDSDRLHVSHHAARQPVASNASEEGRQRNRRTRVAWRPVSGPSAALVQNP